MRTIGKECLCVLVLCLLIISCPCRSEENCLIVVSQEKDGASIYALHHTVALSQEDEESVLHAINHIELLDQFTEIIFQKTRNSGFDLARERGTLQIALFVELRGEMLITPSSFSAIFSDSEMEALETLFHLIACEHIEVNYNTDGSATILFIWRCMIDDEFKSIDILYIDDQTSLCIDEIVTPYHSDRIKLDHIEQFPDRKNIVIRYIVEET